MAKSLSTLQYLDKALGGLRELGLLKGESDARSGELFQRGCARASVQYQSGRTL